MTKRDRTYRIYNTETEQYWATPKRKSVWTSPGNAKNAYTCHVGRPIAAPLVIHEFVSHFNKVLN